MRRKNCLFIINILIVFISGCVTQRVNPYSQAWEEFKNRILQYDGVEHVVLQASNNADYTHINITVDENRQINTEDIVEGEILPAFAQNNDLLSFIIYDHHSIPGGSIDIRFSNGDRYYSEADAGHQKWISANDNSTYELNNFREELVETNLSNDDDFIYCDILDLSEGIFYATSDGEYAINVYVSSTLGEEEIKHYDSEIRSLIADKIMVVHYINGDTLEEVYMSL